MGASKPHPPAEPAEPLVYALDRRGPNDRRVNSAHVLVGLLIVVVVLAGAALL